MLARMHLAGARLRASPAQPARARLVDRDRAAGAAARRRPSSASCCETELAFQQQLAASPAYAALPRGPDPRRPVPRQRDVRRPPARALTGFFDFYFAGVDTFLFDIAVCLNDWCIDLDTRPPRSRTAPAAFVAAYARGAPARRRRAPAAAGAAARRARCASGCRACGTCTCRATPPMLKPHDPAHFERVLRARIARPGTRRWPDGACAAGRSRRQGPGLGARGVRVFFRRPLAFTVLFRCSCSAARWCCCSAGRRPRAGAVAVPLLSLGFMIATRAALHGKPVHPGQFFEPLRGGWRRAAARCRAVRRLRRVDAARHDVWRLDRRRPIRRAGRS